SFTFLPLRCTKKSGRNPLFYVEYDQNGNMTADANKGITSISYNHLNLPTKVTIDNGSDNGTIDYVYDAIGIKLRKEISGSSTGTTEYAGNYIYKNGQLQFFDHPEGYVEPDGSGGYDYIYNYIDNVGNIRLSYTDADNNGSIDPANEIIEENNYYPFGLEHKGYNNVVNGTENNYQTFMGKEHQQELGLETYDFGARNYDPALGRWMNLDPLAEQMRRHSPYNFAFNNPLRFIDPDGMAPNDVVITGGESQAAFDDLQASVQTELTLAKDANGNVTYTQVGTGTLSSDAQQLVDAIDDHSIEVNLVAEDTEFTASGSFYVGGAFSGNTVTNSPSGNTVDATQEVNPEVLSKFGDANSKPGAGTLHEVTEAYQGALVSQASGVSSPAANQPRTVYATAHANATAQPGTITVRYLGADQNRGRGVVLGGYTLGNAPPSGTQRAQYISNGVVIQEFPK
uniref:RHS repeat domain-containing protein n=1 Tax=Flagellimonas sp. 389 TaxID=2835862 RepID=UPI001BD3D0E5